MSNFESIDEQGNAFIFQPDDEFYNGTFVELSPNTSANWSDEQTARSYYLDWLAAKLVFQMYPTELNCVPGISIARMTMHDSVYGWYSQHPTDRERFNASK